MTNQISLNTTGFGIKSLLITARQRVFGNALLIMVLACSSLPAQELQVVEPAESAQLTGMSMSNGVFQFTLNGPAGSEYVILASVDLANWIPILTNTIPVAGSLVISDMAAAQLPRRFYRAVPAGPAQTNNVPSTTKERVFYVATNGRDSWSGGHAAPTWTRTDGPFATVPRAVEAARQWKAHQTNATVARATIFIRGGTYFLTEPLSLTPQDSGLTLAAFPKERPILSGGRRLTGWKPVTVAGRSLWAAQVPEAKHGRWPFRELWINGRRAVLARHPSSGYLEVADLVDASSQWSEGQNCFRFKPGDLQAWNSITNTDVIVMNRWVESRLPITGVNETNHIVSFGKRSVFKLNAGDIYWVEGAFEFLEQPGQWYLDRASGTVYYLPQAGESIRRIEAIAPRLTQIVRLEGNPAAGEFVDGIVFRGLTFAHGEWCFPAGFEKQEPDLGLISSPSPEIGGFGQAAVGVPGAVYGTGARDCSFQECAFTQLGSYGLELAGGCVSNRIVHCEFSDLGAGGIKIGEPTIRSQPAEQTRGNEISDCHIFDGGKLFASAVGIWIGQSADNQIIHNLLHDFYYTGMSIGWSWDYSAAMASNNLVAFNHVHHIGKKSNEDSPVLSDMGGVYTLGVQPGTRIVNNLFHDIEGRVYGATGIYFDAASSGIVAESNLVYRTTQGGFSESCGANNLVQNNVFAFSREQQLQFSWAEPHLSLTFRNNIVYFDSGTLLGGDWSHGQLQMDGNIYFDARAGATVQQKGFDGLSLAQWRTAGRDLHSLVADPLFRAPGQDDLRLESNSPALKLGFHPLDMSEVGVRK